MAKLIPKHGNSEWSLVLRQQFAIKLLRLMESGKKILNVDETPIGDSNFPLKSWQWSSKPVNARQNIINPRITMIVGIDTTGGLYYSLMQANSNDETMRLFLYRLVEELDRKEKGWRKTIVVQLDGAAWHLSNATLGLLKRLNVPTIISGPYQYDGAAIETFFAHLKQGNINSMNLKLSRSKCQFFSLIQVEFFFNVVSLTHQSVQRISKADIVLFFKHTVLQLYK